MIDRAPEVYVTCADCGGEGAIEVWEAVSKWSLDPPSAIAIPCERCGGAGGAICDAEGDQP